MKIESNPSMRRERDLPGIRTIKWKSKNGKITFIEEIPDVHLNNIINLLGRSDSSNAALSVVLRCMKLERNRRQYNPDGEIAKVLENEKLRQAIIVCGTPDFEKAEPFDFGTEREPIKID